MAGHLGAHRSKNAMTWGVNLGIVLGLALLLLVPLGASPAAAGPPSTCSLELVLSATSLGDLSTTGQVTHARNVPVAGSGTLHLPGGAPFQGTANGVQEVTLNARLNEAVVRGQLTGTSSNGTITVQYTARLDRNTGLGSGHTLTTGGTGLFADFRGQGRITAQQVGLLTWRVTGEGPCFTT